MVKAAVTPHCSKCGETLPVNEAGIPVTSVWVDGKWKCPKCLKEKEA